MLPLFYIPNQVSIYFNFNICNDTPKIINFSLLYSFYSFFRLYNYANDFLRPKEKLPVNVEGMRRILAHIDDDDDENYSDVEAPPISPLGDYNISYRAPQYDNTIINYIEKYGFGDFVRV